MTTNSSGLGRPREFELETAARDTMKVFWDRGYVRASLPDLIAGTGLSRESLYKAFGDKKGLLLAALGLYMCDGLRETAGLLSQPGSATNAIKASLLRYARLSSGEPGRRGCLVVSLATEMAAYDNDVAEKTERMFKRLQQLYVETIIRAQENGELPEHNEFVMARFLVCQIEGMRVLGKTGASETEMLELVECTMNRLSQ